MRRVRVAGVSVKLPRRLLEEVDMLVGLGAAAWRSELVVIGMTLMMAHGAYPPPPPLERPATVISVTVPRGLLERFIEYTKGHYATLSDAVRAAMDYAIETVGPLFSYRRRQPEGEEDSGVELLVGRT